MIVLALGLSSARSAGQIDHDTVTRIILGATGLMVVWFGNMMPKRFVPSEVARRVHRVGGWSMVISGLIYAGAFAWLPIQTAVFVGCGAIIAGLAITLGYCQSVRTKARA
ncbi:ammonium transporter [Sphingomonas suaedae]|uniref:Ammonium transporter n=1 Tax=Sphingomonas suaedae TaxID=2599297 RepID=A0A518RLQ4_9SPHN|nr:ammonium transporter [Sphingomonas suaedae]